MGYSAKQRKVKVSIEGADAIVKDLKAMDDAAAAVLMLSLIHISEPTRH